MNPQKKYGIWLLNLKDLVLSSRSRFTMEQLILSVSLLPLLTRSCFSIHLLLTTICRPCQATCLYVLMLAAISRSFAPPSSVIQAVLMAWVYNTGVDGARVPMTSCSRIFVIHQPASCGGVVRIGSGHPRSQVVKISIRNRHTKISTLIFIARTYIMHS